MIRRLLTAALLAGILISTPGCAVLLTGYLIGDAIQRDKAEKACRENLRITNEDRARRGLDLYPDTCGR